MTLTELLETSAVLSAGELTLDVKTKAARERESGPVAGGVLVPPPNLPVRCRNAASSERGR